MPRATAIYARISSDPGGTRLGVERQIEDCEALAGSLGWTVAEVYVDNDVSAYSGRRRPEYERLCDDIKAGVVDGLLVWHPDRLHRSPRELEDFIDLCDAGGGRRSEHLEWADGRQTGWCDRPFRIRQGRRPAAA
jgi:DNA invertase Pin-like site-specific DNA recombinase